MLSIEQLMFGGVIDACSRLPRHIDEFIGMVKVVSTGMFNFDRCTSFAYAVLPSTTLSASSNNMPSHSLTMHRVSYFEPSLSLFLLFTRLNSAIHNPVVF